jgi:hypothetical protein
MRHATGGGLDQTVMIYQYYWITFTHDMQKFTGSHQQNSQTAVVLVVVSILFGLTGIEKIESVHTMHLPQCNL